MRKSPQIGRVSNSATNTGWTAGAGIEVKLSPVLVAQGRVPVYQSWHDLIRSRRDHHTHGGRTAQRPAPPALPRCLHLTSSKDVDFHTVRVGLNYYFNAPPAPLPLK